jgi:hypothetical protein
MEMLIEIEDGGVNVHVALPFDDKWVAAKLKELVEMCPELLEHSDRVEKSRIAVAWLLANIHGHVTTEWVYEALNDLYGVNTMAAIEGQLAQYTPFADRFNGHHRGLFLDDPKHRNCGCPKSK